MRFKVAKSLDLEAVLEPGVKTEKLYVGLIAA